MRLMEELETCPSDTASLTTQFLIQHCPPRDVPDSERGPSHITTKLLFVLSQTRATSPNGHNLRQPRTISKARAILANNRCRECTDRQTDRQTDTQTYARAHIHTRARAHNYRRSISETILKTDFFLSIFSLTIINPYMRLHTPMHIDIIGSQLCPIQRSMILCDSSFHIAYKSYTESTFDRTKVISML